jgi:hypothetical protein
VCPDHFNLAILIIFTVLGSMYDTQFTDIFYSQHPTCTTWTVNIP